LVATKEAHFHENYKKALVSADDEATVIIGRKFQQRRRLLRNDYAAQILQDEQVLDKNAYFEKTSEDHHEIGALKGDFQNGFINAGQIAGLIKDVPSVADLFETMMAEAREVLTEAYHKLFS